MADIKPLGSEKLNGDEKLKRILELTYYNEKNKKSTSNKPELVKESKTGYVFGIVKEKDGYYVKSGLNESSLDYIGGMFMKNKNRFSSYADAFKRLEFIKGQEELNEATKYVLKPNSPKTESPLADPTADAPIAPPAEEPAPAPVEEPSDVPAEDELPTEEPSAETEPEEPSEPKRSDYMAEVQKYAGKLGQELRDLHDRMESDDIKYVLNMIISAVDLDKLEDDDIEEIGKKFERDEEEEVPSEEPTVEPEDEVPAEEPVGDEELGEEDVTMDALERFINTPMDTDEIDLSKYADLEEYDLPEGDMDESGNYDANSRSYTFNSESDLDEAKPKGVTPQPRPEIGAHGEEHMDEEIVELDLDEIKKEINDSINTTLGKYFK